MATVEFMNIRDGYRYEQETNAPIHTEDSKEAVRAFLEKAQASFQGKIATLEPGCWRIRLNDGYGIIKT